MFERDIRPSNKYSKIQKQTQIKLMQHVSQERVAEVVRSLIKFNKSLLVQNKIKEDVDDNIFLTVRFSKNIEYSDPNSKTSLLGGQTPVQVSLPNSIFTRKSEVLLLVKESQLFHIKKAVGESPFLSDILKTVSSF